MQASHHSRHIKRGLAYKESCLICNLSWVKPAIEPIPELVAQETARQDLKRENELDYARIYRLLERRRPAEEIASLFNKSVQELKALVVGHFKVDWETLASRAPQELRNDLMDTVYRKARQGDVRFVLLLERWNCLSGEDDLKGAVTAIGLPKEDLRNLSNEELEARVQRVARKYLSVVGRRPRFSENGKLSNTLELRDAEPNEGLEQAPWIPLPTDADSPTQNKDEISVPDVVVSEPVPEGPPPRGDAIARPLPGVLNL